MHSRRIGRAQAVLFALDVSPAELTRCRAHLDADELARAGAFHRACDRDRYVARRGRLRELLGTLTDRAPAAVRIGVDDHGKPFLPDHPRLRFNLSHARDVALCVTGSDAALGCDIEWRDPELACPGVAARLFAPGERAALARLPRARWVEGFFNCWTRKEAYVKALGLGLFYPLDAFTVSVSRVAAPALAGAGRGWSLRSWEPLPGYQAALAIGPDPAVGRLPRAIAIASSSTSRANRASQPG